MSTVSVARLPVLSLGFRPFFLAAVVYAVFAMAVWFASYGLGLPATFNGLAPALWHAHEMVYGYALAVIAGFLLTAVTNWTGLPTLRGWPLLLLLLLWLSARVSFYLPGNGLAAAAWFDGLFSLYLLLAVARPIVRKRQKQQSGVLSKVLLLGVGNLLFYLGALGYVDQGVQWGLYGGFYLVIGLILTMSRRLIPFFIERGLDAPVALRNSGRVDVAALVLFVVFFGLTVFTPYARVAGVLAGLLFALHLYRLAGWHTAGLWRKPLLWSLYLAYAFITGGFLLSALAPWLPLLKFPALHAFAVGGIGLMTLSMMTRVSLGHTGRSVHEPLRLMPLALALLVVAGLVRVLLPVLVPAFYGHWIELSQLLWMVAFGVLLLHYLPLLLKPARG